jgi:uncharacterized membrane protein
MTRLIKILIWPVLLVPAIYLALAWEKIPAVVPMHYNLAGEPDRYGSKNELLLVLGIMTVVATGLYFLLVNINRIDPKKKYTKENLPRMRSLAFAVCIFISALSCFIIYTSMRPGGQFNSKFITAGVGLLFMVIGNYMYNIKPNYFAGIRLPWTLENENNWKQTHLLAGKIWFAGGLLIAAVALFISEKMMFILMFSVIALMVLIPVIYSYRLYQKQQKNNS